MARRPGAQVLRDLHDTDDGLQELDVGDADGNVWAVGTYRGA